MEELKNVYISKMKNLRNLIRHPPIKQIYKIAKLTFLDDTVLDIDCLKSNNFFGVREVWVRQYQSNPIFPKGFYSIVKFAAIDEKFSRN